MIMAGVAFVDLGYGTSDKPLPYALLAAEGLDEGRTIYFEADLYYHDRLIWPVLTPSR
jgi:hypothetical protein